MKKVMKKLNKPMAILSVRVDPEAYITIPSKWRQNRIVTYEAVSVLPSMFAYAPHSLRRDRAFTAALCRANWRVIIYAEIIDLEIAECAVRANGRAYKHLPIHLRHNINLFFLAFESYPHIIKYAPESVCKNVDVIVAAMNMEYNRLPRQLKINKQITLNAINRRGYELLLPPELHNDPDIINALLRNWTSHMRLRPRMLRITNKDVALKFISYKNIYQNLCKSLQCDPDIINLVLQHNPKELNEAPKKIHNNREFALAMATRGVDMPYLNTFQYDREIIMTAISNRGINIYHLSKRLQRDYEIVLAAVTNNYNAIYGLPGERRYDHDILMVTDSDPLDSAEMLINSARTIGMGVCDKVPQHLQNDALYLEIMESVSKSPRDKIHLDGVLKHITLTFDNVLAITLFERWPPRLMKICKIIQIFCFLCIPRYITEDATNILIPLYKE